MRHSSYLSSLIHQLFQICPRVLALFKVLFDVVLNDHVIYGQYYVSLYFVPQISMWSVDMWANTNRRIESRNSWPLGMNKNRNPWPYIQSNSCGLSLDYGIDEENTPCFLWSQKSSPPVQDYVDSVLLYNREPTLDIVLLNLFLICDCSFDLYFSVIQIII